MESITLSKPRGGSVVVDPDDIMAIESDRRTTVIVTSNYQTYFVEETPEEIGKMLSGGTETPEGGESE